MRRPRVVTFALACLAAAGWLATVGVWLSAAAVDNNQGTLNQGKGLRGLAKQQRSRAARALYATKYHRPAAPGDEQPMTQASTLWAQFQSSDSDSFLSQTALHLDASIPCGGLQVQIMGFHNMSEVGNLSSTLSDYLPVSDPVDSMALKDARCAVVGNSGSLKGSSCGKMIDDFEHVIRFNAAPTVGFEDDAGSRTTLRILNVDTLTFHEDRDQHRAFTIRTKQDAARYLRFMKSKSLQTFLFHPNFWCDIWDFVGDQGLKPSTGLAGVALALKHCRHPVHLFGFDLDAHKYHYFNNISSSAVSAAFQYHPLLAEAKLYRSLQAFGAVVLGHGKAEGRTCET